MIVHSKELIERYWNQYRWTIPLTVERPVYHIPIDLGCVDPNPFPNELLQTDKLTFELYVETNYQERYRIYRVLCEGHIVHRSIEHFD